MKIQSIHIELEVQDAGSSISAPAPLTFWERQFQPQPTKKQTQFDWSYGVIVPLICAAADFIVFTKNGVLAEYATFAHILSASSIMAMAAWLLWGDRLRWLTAALGGFFIAGSAVSLLVGIVLLPYSVAGLFLLIGVLGFTPLFSALVFFRNGYRALNTSTSFLESRLVWQSAVLGGLFGLVIPYVLHFFTKGPLSSYTSVLMQ
jgi:hypothetical protein